MNGKKKPFKVWRFSRFIASIILGFILPLSYALLAAVFDIYFNHGRASKLGLPVTWPKLFLYLFINQVSSKNFEVIFWVLLLGGNILVYGLLVYFVLTVATLLRSSRNEVVLLPPAPNSNEESA